MNRRDEGNIELWLPSVRIEALKRYVTLYITLAVYSALYEYFYATQLTRVYLDPFTVFDYSKMGSYVSLVFLTPLSILPMGVRLRAPGQYIVGALSVFLFIPIPIVFVPMVSVAEFWRIYWLLWIGYFFACLSSSYSLNLPFPRISREQFNIGARILVLLLATGIAVTAMTNHLSLQTLGAAHAARKFVTLSGLGAYLTSGYITSFGGILVGMAVVARKYALLVACVVGYVVCYALIAEREAALMPFWIFYILVIQRWVCRDSVSKYLACVMAPFTVGVLFALVAGTDHRLSVLFYVFSLANYRLFSVPAIGFNVYYNFFELHPLTHWSNIGLVSKFIADPYGYDLPLVMQNAYHLGNYNASFLQTDAVAAAGVLSIPFVCIFFGFILVCINSGMRGLKLTILAVCSAGASIVLQNTGLGPSLLTGGIALMSVLMALIPRVDPWVDSSRRDAEAAGLR